MWGEPHAKVATAAERREREWSYTPPTIPQRFSRGLGTLPSKEWALTCGDGVPPGRRDTRDSAGQPLARSSPL